MIYLEFYRSRLGLNTKDDVFNYIINNLKPSNTLWTYFVNWNKVFENCRNIEISLNTLNYLIGKDNFDEEFKYLLAKNNSLAQVIPSLVVRDGENKKKFDILVDYENHRLIYDEYDFTKEILSAEDIIKYLQFVSETGLKKLFTDKKIKNLVDYMIGVEAGLDSNGRKNRGGHSMENIVEAFIKSICDKKGYRYLKEANAKRIIEQWDVNFPDVKKGKSSRRYDFIVDNGQEIFIFETNFYGGGGSKLKSTAGEYKDLFNTLGGSYKFVWITDGLGWKKAHIPLRDTFENNDYIFNLKMLEQGILDDIL